MSEEANAGGRKATGTITGRIRPGGRPERGL